MTSVFLPSWLYHNLYRVEFKLQDGGPAWIVALFCLDPSVKLYYNIKKVSWHGHSCRTLSTLRPVWWNFYTIRRSLCLLQIYFLKCNDFNLRKKYTKATIYSLFILLVIWTKPNISHIVRKWITGQDCVYLCLFMKMYTIMVVWFWSSRNENTMSVSIRRMS